MENEDFIKVIANNRKARHNYEITSSLEAGLVLQGSEVKSMRAGKASLVDAYGRIRNGELWIIGMHIAQYKEATFMNIMKSKFKKDIDCSLVFGYETFCKRNALTGILSRL